MTEGKQAWATLDRTPKPARFGTRLALVTAFGGLLALMAAVGLDSLRVLRQTQATNSQIHRDFLSRERTLEQIRAALYRSGNTVRDYILLDPGQSTAETLRAELEAIREEMDTALKAYARSLRPEETTLDVRSARL